MPFNLSCPSCKAQIPFNANKCPKCGAKVVGGWDQPDVKKLFIRGALFTLFLFPTLALFNYLLDGEPEFMMLVAEHYVKSSWWQGVVALPVIGGIVNVWLVTWYRRNKK